MLLLNRAALISNFQLTLYPCIMAQCLFWYVCNILLHNWCVFTCSRVPGHGFFELHLPDVYSHQRLEVLCCMIIDTWQLQSSFIVDVGRFIPSFHCFTMVTLSISVLFSVLCLLWVGGENIKCTNIYIFHQYFENKRIWQLPANFLNVTKVRNCCIPKVKCAIQALHFSLRNEMNTDHIICHYKRFVHVYPVCTWFCSLGPR